MSTRFMHDLKYSINALKPGIWVSELGHRWFKQWLASIAFDNCSLMNKFQWNFSQNSKTFIQGISKCRLQNGDHFVSASLCWYLYPKNALLHFWLVCTEVSNNAAKWSISTFMSDETRALQWIPKSALQWLRNERDGVSNHQPHHCLLNRLFRRRSKKTTKLHVTGLCVGNSPVIDEFPAQRASNAEIVSIWWHHHGRRISVFYLDWCKLVLTISFRLPSKHWHCGNRTIPPVPVKQPWQIWVNTSHRFTKIHDTTTQKGVKNVVCIFMGYSLFTCMIWFWHQCL